MLTLQKLKDMQGDQIIAQGVTSNPRLYSEPVRWVAVRGGIWDWALYYHLEEKSYQFVKTQGDKCFTEEVIKELVPCDDEAFGMYRF